MSEYLGYEGGQADHPGARQRQEGEHAQDRGLARSGPFETRSVPEAGPGPSPRTRVALWASAARFGLDAREPPGLIRRRNDGEGYPAPPGPHAQRGGHLEDHRRGLSRPPECGSTALWRSPPSRRPTTGVIRADGPRPSTGSPPEQPASPSGRDMDGIRARGLKDLGPKGGRGFLGAACAHPAGQQGRQERTDRRGDTSRTGTKRAGAVRRDHRPAQRRTQAVLAPAYSPHLRGYHLVPRPWIWSNATPPHSPAQPSDQPRAYWDRSW